MKITFYPIKKHEEIIEQEPIEDIEENQRLFSVEPNIEHLNYLQEIKIREMKDANEAHIRNEKDSPSTAIITIACGADDSNSVCVHKNNCSILDAYDKIIYERLENNEIVGIEVRWCGHYEAKNKWSNLEV